MTDIFQVEIRNQIEQDSDENLDPSLTVPVWYCTSSRAHTTIAKYAEYQAGTLAEAWNGSDVKNSINPTIKFGDGTTRRWIKFGTNCDLSDDIKWEPQLKELMKLPAWARVISPSNMLSHMGHQILGMNTVQLYMKVPCARTPGHQENNNFCAVNINIGPGDSEWFGVPNEYWGALQRLCRKNDVDYLHGSWWPSMKELADAGIPCYRFMQRPGDLVYVNAGCVHWVQAAGWCNNIAWNIGPLSHRQYVLAIERYEWNKTQKFQSIVAMVLLSWNLARNITVSEPKLHSAIKSTLAESIRQTVQTLNFVKSKGRPVKFHGRRKNDPPHYCVKCEVEVFNIILILEREVPHVVNCLKCARKDSPDLSGWVCLEEYSLEELCKVYDNFQLVDTKREEGRLKVEAAED
jgi:lysine-specific demethylase 6A